MELIDPAEAPALYALVEELARGVPLEVALTSGVEVAFADDDGILFVGAPLLATMTERELRALVDAELTRVALRPTLWERLAFWNRRARVAPPVSAALEAALVRLAAVECVYESYARRDAEHALSLGFVPCDTASALAKQLARPGASPLPLDFDLDAFFVTDLLERSGRSRRSMRPAMWDEITRALFVPSLAKRATRSDAPAMVLTRALLESGAEVVAWVGEPCPVFEWRGLRVAPEELAARAERDPAAREELAGWTRELSEEPAPSGIVRRVKISAAS